MRWDCHGKWLTGAQRCISQAFSCNEWMTETPLEIWTRTSSFGRNWKTSSVITFGTSNAGCKLFQDAVVISWKYYSESRNLKNVVLPGDNFNCVMPLGFASWLVMPTWNNWKGAARLGRIGVSLPQKVFYISTTVMFKKIGSCEQCNIRWNNERGWMKCNLLVESRKEKVGEKAKIRTIQGQRCNRWGSGLDFICIAQHAPMVLWRAASRKNGGRGAWCLIGGREASSVVIEAPVSSC